LKHKLHLLRPSPPHSIHLPFHQLFPLPDNPSHRSALSQLPIAFLPRRRGFSKFLFLILLQKNFDFPSNWLLHFAVDDFLYRVVLDDLLLQGLFEELVFVHEVLQVLLEVEQHCAVLLQAVVLLLGFPVLLVDGLFLDFQLLVGSSELKVEVVFVVQESGLGFFCLQKLPLHKVSLFRNMCELVLGEFDVIDDVVLGVESVFNASAQLGQRVILGFQSVVKCLDVLVDFVDGGLLLPDEFFVGFHLQGCLLDLDGLHFKVRDDFGVAGLDF
jgi:hypothetical protein